MRKEETNDILLYPLGFDISRLYNSLVYGVMSESDYKEKGIDFIKSSYDPVHTDEVNLYKYEDYLNDALPGREIKYINNSICLVIESDVLVFPISKESITSIAIPSCYVDTSLNEINYLNFSNMSYDQIKNNCDTFLKGLEKYGFIKDQDKYDEWQSGTLQEVQAEALLCRDLLRSDDLRDASGEPYDWMEIWDDEDDSGQEDVIVLPGALFYRGHYYDNFDEITIRGDNVNNTQIRVTTGQGTLIAKLCTDPNYPGIWLEIDRPEFSNSVAVAKLEVYEDSGRVVLDVYSDALQDEVAEQIPIENLDRWEEGNE